MKKTEKSLIGSLASHQFSVRSTFRRTTRPRASIEKYLLNSVSLIKNEHLAINYLRIWIRAIRIGLK
jgi:hypothetical protein